MAISTGAALGLGAVGGGLLGGGGGGGREPRIETMPTLTPEQQAMATALSEYLQPLIGQPGAVSPGETAGLEAIRQFAAGVTPEEAERRYMETVYPAMERTFREQILPGVSEAFTKTGFYGTPRAEAMAGAEERFGEARMAGIGEAIQRGEQMGFQALPMLMGAEALPFQRQQIPIQQALQFMGQPMMGAYGVPGQPSPISTGIFGALGGAQMAEKIPGLSPGWGGALGGIAGAFL